MGIVKEIKKVVANLIKESDIKIKYPKSKIVPDLPAMARGGTYKNRFPEGVIIHYTAGWQNQKPKDAIAFANQHGHRYMFIDEKGDVYQQFDLAGFGAHAGDSLCPVTKRSRVSQFYLGIEVACGGRLEDADKDGQVDDLYFKKNVPLDRIRSGGINGKYQKINGSFEKFTQAQENALLDLCVWLCQNGCNPDLILGHDEVAPKRKSDPGLSLSVSMDKFRELVKSRLQPKMA